MMPIASLTPANIVAVPAIGNLQSPVDIAERTRLGGSIMEQVTICSFGRHSAGRHSAQELQMTGASVDCASRWQTRWRVVKIS